MKPDDPRIKSPGKYRRDSLVTDVTGRKFGHLTVIKRAGSIRGRAAWLCKCECGNEVVYKGTQLLARDTPRESCGCNEGCIKRKNYSDPLYHIVDEYIAKAGERKKEWHLSYEYASMIMQSPCHYCGRVGSRRNKRLGIEFNGIDRKDNSIGYVDGNVVPCCSYCNYFKGSRGYTEFIDRTLKIAEHVKMTV